MSEQEERVEFIAPLVERGMSWDAAWTLLDRVRADERAKRPGRDQIGRALSHRPTSMFERLGIYGPARGRLVGELADGVLALEPEAREVTDVGPWLDRQGDVWTLGADGFLRTPETAAFTREYVERKWGPLQPAPTDAETDAARAVIVALAPHNMELRPDGSEDREAAAYVAGVQAASDAIPRALAAAAAVRS